MNKLISPNYSLKNFIIPRSNYPMTTSFNVENSHKHKFIHEMEKDPRNELYLPRRIERLLASASTNLNSVEGEDSTIN